MIALDGDTKNSTFSLTYKKAYNDRYVECFIAEQNLVSVGIGLACRDRNIVFCSTFAAFFSRAFDQIRMGAISQTNVNFVGSHAGVSIGKKNEIICLSVLTLKQNNDLNVPHSHVMYFLYLTGYAYQLCY